MVFSSLIFIFLFLPVCLLLYFASPTLKIKNIVLLILSLFFYAWGEPVWVLLLLFSAIVDYTNGRIIGRYRGRWQAKASLVASICLNLGLLVVFKYSGFFMSNINALFSLSLPVPSFALPLGISFYTFQTMSYSIDVYRNEVPVQRSFLDFLLFVSLFPQLVAGPIVRYSEIAAQLSDRRTTLSDFTYGITRFLVGLGKKVLLANYAGSVVNGLFETSSLASLSVLQGWLGIFLYAFQIYFDFSGYSDMAIGLGRMFGFEYGENFNYPYISRSVTEFWRRWHISLGSFFRDYVYIPLGGNRRMQMRNMLVVWFLTGFWHGASWNFIFWGLYFFVLLLLEKTFLKKILDKIPRVFSTLYAFFAAVVGWILFYFTDLGRMGDAFRLLFGGLGAPVTNTETQLLLVNNIPLILLCIIGATPLLGKIGARISGDFSAGRLHPALYGTMVVAFNTALLFLSTVSLVGSSYNPFIYFRF
ncbi:MBOAT family protein [Oscillospiraceae bacterium OttesenSCG-928-G22]|nr:MBOAT family protein [Oscillospiraceae bacterium OttesenSCG-928-G22]